jgi:hypothetical protein
LAPPVTSATWGNVDSDKKELRLAIGDITMGKTNSNSQLLSGANFGI